MIPRSARSFKRIENFLRYFFLSERESPGHISFKKNPRLWPVTLFETKKLQLPLFPYATGLGALLFW